LYHSPSIIDLWDSPFLVNAILTAEEQGARVVTDLLVEKSITSKGLGKLVGQMDPHTVEIIIDGTPSAFQLNKTAIQQLAAMEDGDLVTFVNQDNNQQKTIDNFILE
jgi:hypothetical protein